MTPFETANFAHMEALELLSVLVVDAGRAVLADLEMRDDELLVRRRGLGEITLRQFGLDKRKELVVVPSRHLDVDVIVPRNDAPVPGRAQKRPRADVIRKPVPLADSDDNLKDVQQDFPRRLALG